MRTLYSDTRLVRACSSYPDDEQQRSAHITGVPPKTKHRDPAEEVDLPGAGMPNLIGLALLFLKLGAISFGGPVAHIAMMEDEVVHRRRWMSREEFLDYLGSTNLIPGPNSTEMAIHIGRKMMGTSGLVVAGVCFILPAATMVCLLAWLYANQGSVPVLAGMLYGVKPVVIAIVIQALLRFTHTAVSSVLLACIGVAAFIASAFGIPELLVLLAAGLIMFALRTRGAPQTSDIPTDHNRRSPFGAVAMLALAPTAAAGFSLTTLFLTFLKIGAVLYGSGYVLFAFMRADFVERLGWISETQLVDAVAVGQMTPGPVFTAATFVGFLLAGVPGALVATVAIFLPAFLFVAASGSLIPRIRASARARAVLDGVNVASLALMALVTFYLARAALVDTVTVAIAMASALLLFRFKMNSALLIAAGGIIGVAL